jgi:guanylate kinase
VLDIEVKGAEQLQATFPNAIHVFVLPPSGAELVRRLEGRGTEGPGVVQRRLQIAAEELAVVEQYDYVVVNDDLTAAVRRVGAIIDAEAARPSRLKNLATMVEVMRRGLGAALHQQ